MTRSLWRTTVIGVSLGLIMLLSWAALGSAASVRPHAERAATPTQRVGEKKCKTRRYKLARVCRDGHYKKHLLWIRKHRHAPPQVRPSRRADEVIHCTPQADISPTLRAKAKLLFGTKLCIRRYDFRTDIHTLHYWYVVGQMRCVVMNTSPGSPFSTLLSEASAARFCGDNDKGTGWGYVWGN